MKKLQIEIPILLPKIPDEKDQCVQRLLASLKDEKGIDDVHIKEGIPAEICIHYDPNAISLKKVKQISKQSGASLTHRFQHSLIDVKGVRHQRHARNIGDALMKETGIVEASVSVAGILRLEWDSEKAKKAEVMATVEKNGLKISKEAKDQHEHGEGDGHDHAHGGFLGENTELYFAIGSGVFWLTGLILSFQEEYRNGH